MKEFDESKHKRDKLGRFAKMSARELSEELKQEIVERETLKQVNSGGKSGALNSDSERANEHAVMMYETFRNDKWDVGKISKFTGFSEDELREIKEYLFNNPDFLPDYDIAQSWDRLRKDNFIEADFILLKHELYEMQIKKENPNISHREAHDMANEVYNYSKALEDYKNGDIKKKRSNKR